MSQLPCAIFCFNVDCSRGSAAKSARQTTIVIPADAETYGQKRLAEFFLKNAMDKKSYREACNEVKSMSLDPDKIPHRYWPS